MSVILTGSIELNGTTRIEVTSDKITATCTVFLKGSSGPLQGAIVISEMTPGVGFGMSSTDPTDIGTILYFDVNDT
jgi:hypothetical protein